MIPPPHLVLADRFELGRIVGAGGMGVVHEAIDRLTGQRVAVKLLRSSNVVDITRFEREATLLKQLGHPGIVRYVAHGVAGPESGTAAGKVWLAMEWLEGMTVAEKLQRGGLDPAEAVSMIRQAAAALADAHARGVVHRDLKPANLFLDTQGTAEEAGEASAEASETKGTTVGSGTPRAPTPPAAVCRVLDFGIARQMGRGHTLTATGAAIGTPHYMSPEQARADKRVDARTDVYALGVVLYECLSGRRPFEGDTALAVLAKILLEDAPALAVPNLPEPVEQFVMSMLAKDPAARPEDGAGVVAGLDALDLETLSARKARPSLPPALGTSEQRLLCVVMVADVGGYGASAPTVLSTDELSGDLHGELRELAQSHGAAVELVADGSMVASIGSRGVVTDQAERAARLALALRAVLPEAPIAVVAGRSVVTSRLPAGEVIDRGAAALSDTVVDPPEAEPGPRAIRIDDVVDGLLDERFFRTGDAGLRRLHRMRPVERARRTLLGREVACMGRRRELGTLEAIFEEATEEPVARVVWVEAPAGGGKTRVVEELLERIDAPHTLMFGAADPMQGAPYAALASAIRRSADIIDGEPLEIRRRKLASHVARVAVGAERARLTVFLGELVRVPFQKDVLPALEAARHDPQLMSDGVRSALEDWMALECAAQPVVLVLEDLQWADQPTVHAVDGLLRRLEEAPLFVVATGRPEARERFPDLWAERDLQEVRLARLTRRAAGKLVRAALEDADDESVDRIVERGDGNAFFLEELVRAVGRGEGDGDLPDSVLGMIETRLTAMDGSGRRVLRAASVLGARFWTGAVQRLLGRAGAGEIGADRWLSTFADDELLTRREVSAIAGETEWVFRQSAVRDAAYAMLTDEDRTLGHRLAADWLQEAWSQGHGVSDPEILAHHFSRGDSPDRAAQAFAEAASRALEASDLERAAGLAESGRSEAARGASNAALLGELALLGAEAHRWRGEYALAAAFARDALDHLTPGTAPYFQALGNGLVSAGITGEAKVVDEYTERARVTADGSFDAARERLIALCRGAHQMLGRGQLDAADALIEAANEAALGDVVSIAWRETTAAARALHAGNVSVYLDHTAAAVQAYDQAGDQRHASNQRVRLGYGWMEIGALEEAQTALVIARESSRRLGLSFVEGFALQNLGWATAQLGDLDAGRALQYEALELGKNLSSPPLIGGAWFYLSRIAQRSGDMTAAHEAAERALEAVEGIPPLRVLCLAAKALALHGLGHEAAAACAREATDAIGALVGMEGDAVFVWRARLQCDPDATSEARDRARDALERRATAMRKEHVVRYRESAEPRALTALLG